VLSVQYGSDGKTIVSCGEPIQDQPGVVELWNVPTGKRASSYNTLDESYEVNSDQIAFSPDGRTLAEISAGGPSPYGVNLWNTSTDTMLKSWSSVPTSYVYSLVYSRDGSLLVSAGSGYPAKGSVVQIWNATTGALIRNLNFDASEVQVALSPNGTILAVSGTQTEGTGRVPLMQLWSVPSGHLIRSMDASGAQGLSCVAFSRDGRLVAAGQLDFGQVAGGRVLVWDAGSGNLVRTLDTGMRKGISTIAFSPDGSKLAVARAYQVDAPGLAIWSVHSWQQVGSIEPTCFTREPATAYKPSAPTGTSCSAAMNPSRDCPSTRSSFPPTGRRWHI
jgi:WD40 repeat protein